MSKKRILKINYMKINVVLFCRAVRAQRAREEGEFI